jgi:hypothetical protein
VICHDDISLRRGWRSGLPVYVRENLQFISFGGEAMRWTGWIGKAEACPANFAENSIEVYSP